MKTRYALAIIAFALPCGAYLDNAKAAPAKRSIYLNQWQGINSCTLAKRARDVRYCKGANDPQLNAELFNCGFAETMTEYRFCANRAAAMPRVIR